MSSSQRIQDVIYDYPMADVEEYFQHMNGVIGLNSGTNDYQMVTHDVYAKDAPIANNQNGRFRVTDSSIDIIDVSQGYISLTAEIEFEMQAICYNKYNELSGENIVPTVYSNLCWWFIGFKSGSHIIRSYAVYANGQATACKQVSAVEEQTIVYNCKSKEERKARPGMYSAHEDVCKMRNCVCGTYIRQPDKWKLKEGDSTKRTYVPADDADNGWNNGKKKIALEICIQMDDLLPFSGMTYFPRFVCGELELEIKFALEKNLVFCQIPIDEVLNTKLQTCDMDYIEPMLSQVEMKKGGTTSAESDRMGTWNYNGYGHANSVFTNTSILPMFNPALTDPMLTYQHRLLVDSRFHQFGQWQRGIIGISNSTKGFGAVDKNEEDTRKGNSFKNDYTSNVYFTFSVGNETDAKSFAASAGVLNISEAQSHVYGFNIKSTAKENISKEIRTNGLIIPAQWIQYNYFNQKPGTNFVKYTGVHSFWEVGQLLFTFNKDNAMTVSRNPFLDDVRCQLGNRLIPDKGVSTNSNEYAEMAISALSFDTLFSASDEFINSISPVDVNLLHKKKFRPLIKDDSDWMFVCDLERNGNGTYADGFSGRNVPINFSGNFINGTDNPFWYPFDVKTTTKTDFKYPLRFNSGDNSPNGNATEVAGSDTNPLQTDCKLHCFAVGDAYWKFDSTGGRFIKDSEIVSLIRDREQALKDRITQQTFQKDMMDAQGGNPFDPMAKYRLNQAATNSTPSVLNGLNPTAI